MTELKMLSMPEVTESINSYLFTWEAEQITAKVGMINAHKSGIVDAEITVKTTRPGYGSHLAHSSINIAKSRGRQDLVKVLSSRIADIDWSTAIDQVCLGSLERIRKGELVDDIDTCQDVQAPEYLIYPFIPKDQPTIFYGDSGTGKSYLVLYLAMSAIINKQDCPGNIQPKGKITPLILDWETSRDEVAWRLHLLTKGNGNVDLHLKYRRCAMPLVDDLEQIQETIRDIKANFIIMDSLALACGGELNSAEPVIKFYAACRKLKTTILIVAHIGKGTGSSGAGVYGSAFFKHYARSVWEINSRLQDNITKLGIIHKKVNNSSLHTSVALKLVFNKDENDRLTEVNVEQGIELPATVSSKNPDKIIALLKEKGPLTARDILSLTDIKSLGTILTRMKDQGRLVQLPVPGDKWDLSVLEKDE